MKEMDRVGVEPTTSAMTATFYIGAAMKREIHIVQLPPVHYLASFFLRLRLTVHGYGAKNTASKLIKSFQGFEGTGKGEGKEGPIETQKH
jgi:hypothetical protein